MYTKTRTGSGRVVRVGLGKAVGSRRDERHGEANRCGRLQPRKRSSQLGGRMSVPGAQQRTMEVLLVACRVGEMLWCSQR